MNKRIKKKRNKHLILLEVKNLYAQTGVSENVIKTDKECMDALKDIVNIKDANERGNEKDFLWHYLMRKYRGQYYSDLMQGKR